MDVDRSILARSGSSSLSYGLFMDPFLGGGVVGFNYGPFLLKKHPLYNGDSFNLLL